MKRHIVYQQRKAILGELDKRRGGSSVSAISQKLLLCYDFKTVCIKVEMTIYSVTMSLNRKFALLVDVLLNVEFVHVLTSDTYPLKTLRRLK